MTHRLPYAHPPQQVTTADRVGWAVMRGIVRGGWIVLTLIILSGAAATASSVGGQPSGYFAMVMAGLLLIAWGRWRSIARQRRAQLLLAPVRLAVSLNLPLQQTLDAAQQGESGRLRRQLLQLRVELAAGADLASALKHAAPEMPARTIDTITAAERTGTLSRALGRLLEEEKRQHSSDSVNRSVQFGYSLTVLIALCVLIGLTTIYVLPKFEQIMVDFKVTPPRELQMLGSINDSWVWLILLMLIATFTLISMVGNAAQGIFSRSAPRPMFRALSDRVLWYLPISHSIQRNGGLADVCDVLADGFMNGCSTTDAVDLAIQPHLNRVLSAKLRRWSDRLKNGEPISTAAASAGLPPLMVAMLAGSPANNGSVPAFQFLARYFRDRHNRLIVLLSAAFAPASSLVLGSVVLLVTLAIFRSLVSLDASITYPGAP